MCSQIFRPNSAVMSGIPLGPTDTLLCLKMNIKTEGYGYKVRIEDILGQSRQKLCFS